MGLESRSKRESVLNFGLPFWVVLPEPDGSIDVDDRAHVSHMYAGAGFEQPVVNLGARGGGARFEPEDNRARRDEIEKLYAQIMEEAPQEIKDKALEVVKPYVKKKKKRKKQEYAARIDWELALKQAYIIERLIFLYEQIVIAEFDEIDEENAIILLMVT